VISKDPGNNPRRVPDLAYNRKRNEYLVVWQNYDNGANLYDIYGRLITGSGTPLNPAEIVIFQTTAQGTNPAVSAIPTAGTNGQYLVVFEMQASPTNLDIYSRVVNGDGTVGSGYYIASSVEDERNPSVAGSETAKDYLIVWSRPTSPPIVYNYIEGKTISTAGHADSGKFVAGFPSAARPAVASGPSGDFLVTFDDKLPPTTDLGIYGQLWGNRIYLPITLR
jgi:hypothetical protein